MTTDLGTRATPEEAAPVRYSPWKVDTQPGWAATLRRIRRHTEIEVLPILLAPLIAVGLLVVDSRWFFAVFLIGFVLEILLINLVPLLCPRPKDEEGRIWVRMKYEVDGKRIGADEGWLAVHQSQLWFEGETTNFSTPLHGLELPDATSVVRRRNGRTYRFQFSPSSRQRGDLTGLLRQEQGLTPKDGVEVLPAPEVPPQFAQDLRLWRRMVVSMLALVLVAFIGRIIGENG